MMILVCQKEKKYRVNFVPKNKFSKDLESLLS